MKDELDEKDCISVLEDLAFECNRAVDMIDDLEGRSPSYLGGIVRGAERLLLDAWRILSGREGRNND